MILLDLLCGFLFWALAISLGYRLCRWWQLGIKFEASAIALWAALGAGMLSYLISALGSLGAVSRIVAYSLTLVLFAVLSRDLWDCCRGVRNWLQLGWRRFASRKLRLALLGLILVHLALNLAAALAPPSAGDALRYHLNAPRAYIYQGRISFIPYAQWNYPFATEMLYMLGMLLYSNVVPAVFTCFCGVLIALGIYGIARRFFGQTAATWAAVLFYEMPLVTLLSANAKNDLVFVLFGLSVIIAWMAYRSTGSDWRWLLAVGTLLGFVGGTRTNGLFFIVSVLVAFAADMFSASSSVGVRRRVSHVLLLGALAGFVAAPWYIRNWIAAGDPLWPMGYALFKGRFMDKYLYETWANERGVGFGFGLVHLLLGPWNFTMRLEELNTLRMPTSVVPLAFLPGLVLINWKRFSGARRWLALVGIVCGLYYLCWFFSYQYLRLLLITAPFLMVGAGLVVARTWDFPYWFRWIFRFAIISSSLAYLVTGLLFARQFVPVVAGFQDRDAFLAEKTTLYRTFQYANNSLPAERCVLVTWQNDYYLAQPKINMAPVRQSFYIAYDHLQSADAFMHRVCELGVSHILTDSYTVNKVAADMKVWGIQDNLTANVFGALESQGRLKVIYDQPDVRTRSRTLDIQEPLRAVIYEVRCE